MLARLQQCLVLGLAALAALWWWWSGDARVATGWRVAALAAILLPHAPVLALEFLLLAFVADAAPAQRPTPGQLLRAWAGEVIRGVLVFGWCQPWRERALPNHLPADSHGRRGVLLIHGFVCNRGFWNPWLRRLGAGGHAFLALSLEPVFGAIDAYADAIEDGIRRLERATGRPPLIVAHSMGGLAARAWWVRHGAPGRCAGLVTIGSPHHGTWLARWAFSRNGREMRLHSHWLRRLADAERGAPAWPRTCYFSHCDNIVFPARTALLPGAEARHVDGMAHVQLAFNERLVAEVLRRLDEPAEAADPVQVPTAGG